MSLSLKDVRFTVRRATGRNARAAGDGGDETGLPILYPRLLRDAAILPKVAIAIRYFESMVGAERREVDSEVLVQFFGDHKLARCIVACLARSYRFHAADLREVVTPAALRRLERAGLASPQRLRLHLFDHVNASGDGFLTGNRRDATLDTLASRLGLGRSELDRLLVLDSEEHAVLTRVGEAPDPKDIVAHYNFAVLAGLLRHAERVDLTLRPESWSPGATSALQALCATAGVALSLGAGDPERAPGQEVAGHMAPRHLTLRGRQDSLGLWSRHGRKLARTVVQLLERSRSTVVAGMAVLATRDRRLCLRLTPEVLDILAGETTPAGDVSPRPASWHDLAGWSAAEIDAALTVWRRASDTRGWTVRRYPEPQAWAAGVVVPDLLIHGHGVRALLCVVRSPEHAARLARPAGTVTTGEPLVFAGHPAATGILREAGARVVAQPALDVPALLHALPELLHRRGVPSLPAGRRSHAHHPRRPPALLRPQGLRSRSPWHAQGRQGGGL